MEQQPSSSELVQVLRSLVRNAASRRGTGLLGSEHVALLAVGGAGGLAELTGIPADILTEALAQGSEATRAIPVGRPTCPRQTERLLEATITIAAMRGRTVPIAADIVGALLHEPGSDAWVSLAPLGVTARSVEIAQRAAFERDSTPSAHLPPGPRPSLRDWR